MICKSNTNRLLLECRINPSNNIAACYQKVSYYCVLHEYTHFLNDSFAVMYVTVYIFLKSNSDISNTIFISLIYFLTTRMRFFFRIFFLFKGLKIKDLRDFYEAIGSCSTIYVHQYTR